MAATETAVPFSGTAITTSQQYRDRYRPTQPDMIDADYGSTALAVSDGGAGASINIQNGGAVVQAGRYDLTGGPLNLTVAANGGGSNRFDIVCLTYDSSHSPPIYSRIVQGTAGAGLPALTNSLSGIWDFPIAHYQKTTGGSITGMTDRRKYRNGNGSIMGADDTTGTSGLGWFNPAPAVGEEVTFWPSGTVCRWSGSAWVPLRSSQWNALTLNSGFVNQTFGYNAAWRWCGANQIELRGTIAKTAGAAFVTTDVPITLPSTPINLRPAQSEFFICAGESTTSDKNVRVDIASTGTMTVVFNVAGYTPHWICIDNVKLSLS